MHIIPLSLVAVLVNTNKRIQKRASKWTFVQDIPFTVLHLALVTESVSAFFLVSILDPGRPCVALGQILLIIVLEVFGIAFVLCAFQQLEHKYKIHPLPPAYVSFLVSETGRQCAGAYPRSRLM